MCVNLTAVEVIFFDAAGTLFHVRGSVGEIYTAIARKYDVTSQPAEVEEAFVRAFRAKSTEGIPPHASVDRSRAERRWWMDVVRQAFAERMPESVLPVYFEEVFDAFRGPAGWELYSDTMATLRKLRAHGYRLGILSNFDTRLQDVVRNLGIGGFFDSIVFSWCAGFAKPDERIFQHALKEMRVPATGALHVGDSLEEDYKGASRAGMHALLLDRENDFSDADGILRITSLSELSRFLPKHRYPTS